IFPVDDAGRVNDYPLMRLTATEKVTGKRLASLDVVLPVSEEINCSGCHATGGVATHAPGMVWSTGVNLEVQARENVLLLHDSHCGTPLMQSKPVLCAGCHYSAPLDLAGTGPTATQLSAPTLSASIHGYHANRMFTSGASTLLD